MAPVPLPSSAEADRLFAIVDAAAAADDLKDAPPPVGTVRHLACEKDNLYLADIISPSAAAQAPILEDAYRGWLPEDAADGTEEEAYDDDDASLPANAANPSGSASQQREERVLSHCGVVIIRSDLDILGAPRFINDRIIAFYFAHLSAGFEDDDLLLLPPSIPYLLSKHPDAASVNEVAAPLRLASRRLVLIPVNDNADASEEGDFHWSLLVLDRAGSSSAPRFVHHDSGRDAPNLTVATRLADALRPLLGTAVPFVQGQTPTQTNAHDGGVYVMAIAKAICAWWKGKGRGEDWLEAVRREVDACSVRALKPELRELIHDKDSSTSEAEVELAAYSQTQRVSYIFVCHGSVDTWPSSGRIFSSLAASLARTIQKRSPEMNNHHKIVLALFDSGDTSGFVQGDVLLFPQRLVFRSMNVSETEAFVDNVIMETGLHGEALLDYSCVFICCRSHTHTNDYTLRECSICGPVILSYFSTEVREQGLESRVGVFACTSTSDRQGDLILFSASGGILQYKHVYPGFARLIVSDVFGDGTMEMTAAPSFEVFWKNLLDIILITSQMRVLTDAVPLHTNMSREWEVMKVWRDQILGSSTQKLGDLLLQLRRAAALCQIDLAAWDWVKEVSWEVKLVTKTMYMQAGAAQKKLKARVLEQMLAVLPTQMECEARLGYRYVAEQVGLADELGNHVIKLMGSKPIPKSRALTLLEPIMPK